MSRRQRPIRKGAEGLRCRDRLTSARERNDCPDGIGLRGRTVVVVPVRVAQERREAQHERDRTCQMVLYSRLGTRGGRRRADPWRKWLLRRISCRTLLPQLQRRGDLRRNPGDPQDHAGGLPAWIPDGSADALYAAGLARNQVTRLKSQGSSHKFHVTMNRRCFVTCALCLVLCD